MSELAEDLFLFGIGEVARRVSIPTTTLRAWERRYGVPSPTRTDKGYRLYDRRALSEIAALVRHRSAGIRPQQAALLVRNGRVIAAGAKAEERLRAWRQRLQRACLRFDEAGANAVISGAAEAVGLLDAFKEVVLPVLARLGDAWHAGLINISQEHFVSQLAHHVALQLCHVDSSRRRSRPVMLTGCAPQERHEFGLLLVIAELRKEGYEIVHLGSDVPVGTFLSALDATGARVAVIGVTIPAHLRYWRDQIQQVRRRERHGATFVWAGPGAQAARGLPGTATVTIDDAVSVLRRLLRARGDGSIQKARSRRRSRLAPASR